MSSQQEIVNLIEREEELKCYDSLYNNKLINLQKRLQKKKISREDYEVSRERIVSKIKKNKEEQIELTKSINSKIMNLKNVQSDVIQDWLFQNE